MKKRFHKEIRCILRFIIRHNRLANFFAQFEWYRDLCQKEARMILRESQEISCIKSEK